MSGFVPTHRRRDEPDGRRSVRVIDRFVPDSFPPQCLVRFGALPDGPVETWYAEHFDAIYEPILVAEPSPVPEAAKPVRKVVQLVVPHSTSRFGMCALCDDGTIWGCGPNEAWEQFPPIPGTTASG